MASSRTSSAPTPRRALHCPAPLRPGFFLGKRAGSGRHADTVAGREALDQAQGVARAQRDAAGGRRQALGREVQEDRTAAALNAGAIVVSQHDDDIVEAVRAPQALGARGVGERHGAVVIAIARGVAPAVTGPQRTDLQARLRPRDAVGPIEDLAHRPTPHWRGAVAFALAHAPAVPAQCACENEGPKCDKAGLRAGAQPAHHDLASQSASHSLLLALRPWAPPNTMAGRSSDARTGDSMARPEPISMSTARRILIVDDDE